jgi:hypothetical protein
MSETEEVDMSITITHRDGRLAVESPSPYNPEFPPCARALGGRWDRVARVWTFDARVEPSLRYMLRALFGTDGSL